MLGRSAKNYKIMPLPNITTISEQEEFYGYLTALELRITDTKNGDMTEAYATFYYNGNSRSYIVPDENLFKILSEFLASSACEHYHTGCLGVVKLYIEKKGDEWLVDLP